MEKIAYTHVNRAAKYDGSNGADVVAFLAVTGTDSPTVDSETGGTVVVGYLDENSQPQQIGFDTGDWVVAGPIPSSTTLDSQPILLVTGLV